MPLVAPLFEGPLDIVGDIHGEIDPLYALLSALGYDPRGEHPDERRVVFVGDLCDRGPDSSAVIELVRELVGRGRAQCLVGNHELNILRGDQKHGNRWFLDPSHREQRAEFAHSKPARDDLKATWLAFFESLPVALERKDLRVVHAAWHTPSIEVLRTDASATPLDTYRRHTHRVEADLAGSGLAEAAAAEEREHADALIERSRPMHLLPNLARRDELYQMGNPLKVVTSGLERATTKPFWSSGKWRMCDRVRWWDEYTEETAVLVGHYWRIAAGAGPSDLGEGKPDLFAGHAPNAWVGARRNVFCVDFSVGGRYAERAKGRTAFATRLAAVRWPEHELVFDDGERVVMTR